MSHLVMHPCSFYYLVAECGREPSLKKIWLLAYLQEFGIFQSWPQTIAFSLPEASQDPAFHFLVQDFHKNPHELVLCRNARTCSHWICQITTLMRRRLWRYIHTYHPDISHRLPTPKINVWLCHQNEYKTYHWTLLPKPMPVPYSIGTKC